jgi:hypothetical protein
MAENRTSVAIAPALKRRIQKRAKMAKPPMGWTVKLVLLAEKELEREEAVAK